MIFWSGPLSFCRCCQVRSVSSDTSTVEILAFCAGRLLTKKKSTSKCSKENTVNCLTLNGPGHFRIHPKIWCLNFKPQYLLNYSSPTKDSERVRKRTIRAFILIFKLLGWEPHWLRTLCQNFARLVSVIAFQHVPTHARVTLTQSWYQ